MRLFLAMFDKTHDSNLEQDHEFWLWRMWPWNAHCKKSESHLTWNEGVIPPIFTTSLFIVHACRGWRWNLVICVRHKKGSVHATFRAIKVGRITLLSSEPYSKACLADNGRIQDREPPNRTCHRQYYSRQGGGKSPDWTLYDPLWPYCTSHFGRFCFITDSMPDGRSSTSTPQLRTPSPSPRPLYKERQIYSSHPRAFVPVQLCD